MTTLTTLRTLIAQGESETFELKRSTAELRRAGETLGTFLNGEGGKVLIGVGPDGRLIGHEVANITLRNIAAMLDRFEPTTTSWLRQPPERRGVSVPQIHWCRSRRRLASNG